MLLGGHTVTAVALRGISAEEKREVKVEKVEKMG
jgi:hypothetical protein